MGDELSLLLEIFNKIEKAGGQATLCVATGGGKTKVKLEITTTPAPPTGSTPTSSGWRQRRRGPRAWARRNQRAAAHQAALQQPPVLHCTMCILGSTMALWSKAEIQKYTF